MIRTFQALKHVPPGFSQPEHVQTLRIFIPESAVKDPVAVVHTEQQILDKLAAIPGVSSVGLTTVIPMDGSGWHDPVFVEDHPLTDGQLPRDSPLQVHLSGPVEDDGQPARRRPRLHVGRDLRETACRHDLGESGARAVARSCRGNRQAGAGESENTMARDHRCGRRRAR